MSKSGSGADAAEKFKNDFDINLDLSKAGNDPIGFCLTGNISVVKSSSDSSSDSSTSVEASDDTEAMLNEQLLGFDPINSFLTGGDSCRYCVDQCPKN